MVRFNIQRHPECAGSYHDISTPGKYQQKGFQQLILLEHGKAQHDKGKVKQADKQQLEKPLAGIFRIRIFLRQ